MNISASQIDETIQEIKQGINKSETVVFCGAGISLNSGLPTVNQFVPYLMKVLGLSDKELEILMGPKLNDLRLPFESLIEILGESGKIDKILDIFDGGEPNTTHLFFAKLAKVGKVRTIVTTNFDRLFERALRDEGVEYNLFYKEDEFKDINWNDDRLRLIKIHGSVHDKNNMAITIKRIADHILSDKRADVIRNVFSSGKHRNILIMGYSSSDVFDINPIVETIESHHKKVFYIQHQSIENDSRNEEISILKTKNPFIRFQKSVRIYCDTNDLVKALWGRLLLDGYMDQHSLTNWQSNITDWAQPVGDFPHRQLSIVGRIFANISEFLISIRYFEEIGRISINKNDDLGLWLALYNLGNVYDICEDHLKTIIYQDYAVKLARQYKDPGRELNALHVLGNGYRKIENFPKAFENYNDALRIARSKEFLNRRSEGAILGSLGNLFLAVKDPKAIGYFNEALEIARSQEISDKLGEEAMLVGLGLSYCNLKEYQKAIEDYFLKALKIAVLMGDRIEEGKVLGNVGDAYLNFGNFSRAYDYLDKSLNILRPILGEHNRIVRMLLKSFNLTKEQKK